jgi:hypothetical protein
MSKFEIGAHRRKYLKTEVRFMVRAGGYVMCRVPRCVPFIMTEKEWRKLEPIEEPKKAKQT